MWRALSIIASHQAWHLAAAQPLAGGGGGGGGGFGGGFDGGESDYDYDAAPSCPRHCYSCTVDDECDVCYSGYKLMRDGSCRACPPGCKRCDVHGPHGCDECAARYVLASRKCEPCADHCKRCRAAGPGACDDGECDWGYVKSAKSKVCEACTKHCGKCFDTTDSGCLNCKAFYRLDEGRCVMDMEFLAGVFVALAVVVFTIRFMHNRGRARSAAGTERLFGSLTTHDTFVSASEISPSSSESSWRSLPSGVWKGYYTHSGARHNICEFTLQFGQNGLHSISGGGVDDVGEYAIQGLCNHTGTRLAFTKSYVGRSRNISNVVSFGNQGHSVEYRGELVTGEGGSLGGGFHGDWAIRHQLGNHNGTFHIWPAMEGWQNPETESDTEPQRNFEVESECVVCFDNPITTILQPCRHQVLCRDCADLLRSPRRCPICRAIISVISDIS